MLSSVTGKMLVLQMYVLFCVYIFPQRAWVEKSDKSEKKKNHQSFSEMKKFKQLGPSVSQACLNQQGEQYCLEGCLAVGLRAFPSWHGY